MSDKKIRIGGASGFWGDAARATPQLLADGGLDYIVYDYLAEITMSIMARARAKNSELGYAVDFVTAAMQPNLAEIARQGVKILSNAGGVNPQACATALRTEIAKQGLSLKVACVVGDDLLEHREALAGSNIKEMFTAAEFPEADRLQSINAYLGAFPIAQALDAGADIVVTGRSVDSAVTLGACIHSFAWQRSDSDQLAAGSLAGHIIECGPQATGGNFTDWETVVDSLHDIGYPIAEVEASGEFVCTKPVGTGGVVNVGTVSEQMLYEIGDPQAYILPDVVCDFSNVQLSQQGSDRVLVKGASGLPAPSQYKVCATYADEFRGGTLLTFYGEGADKRARALADAVFRAARITLGTFGMPDYSETSVEVLGVESHYGDYANVTEVREVVVKIAAKHADMIGIGILLKELVGLGLATPPGMCGFQGGRPKPSPVLRLFSFLLERKDLPVNIEIDGELVSCDESQGEPFDPELLARPTVPAPDSQAKTVAVPLRKLAWGRSGDKGDKANVGIIARKAEYLPYINAVLDEEAVRSRFAHFLQDNSVASIDKYLLPGSNAINFLIHDVLGGGGMASIRSDAQGKGYAQLLLACPIAVPAEIAASL